MEMSYSKNPYLPCVRRDAADLVRKGWGVRKVARYVGVSPGTITKWVRKSKQYGHHPIPTLSSRPRHHPKELSSELVWKIFHKRLAIKRSAEVVHQELVNEGVCVSLASVKRTLDRTGLLKKRSPWKRYHPPIGRPNAETQGDLVQIDTIHLLTPEGHRVYVYTLLDVYSRWAYAWAYAHANTRTTLRFIQKAQGLASFQFKTVQSDNGGENRGDFHRHLVEKGIAHYFIPKSSPNWDGAVERAHGVIDQEYYLNPRHAWKTLEEYLHFYNFERIHLGKYLNGMIPVEKLNYYLSTVSPLKVN